MKKEKEITMAMQTKAGKPARSRSRRGQNRSGGCSRKPSALRPVSAGFPAFFQNPYDNPKGFSGFGERGDFSAS
jgi:hypothetical protein